MVRYIIDLANMVNGYVVDWQNVPEWKRILPRCENIVHEMRKLKPVDFPPESQADFVIVLQELEASHREWAGNGSHFVNDFREGSNCRKRVTELMEKVIGILEKYGGPAQQNLRSFPFVKDVALRDIIERDYAEMRGITFRTGAWKSTVIMAGSIAEAILLDVLFSDPATRTIALASSKAPRQGGRVKDPEDWHLRHLFEVAIHIGIIPAGRGDTFDHVLRDYRNFVHPRAEVRQAYPCKESEAGLAVYGVDALCNILENP